MANAAIAMLEGWTITSVETIENYSRTDDTCLNILDEIKNITLSNSEDSADVTGKNDTVLFTIKKNKAVEGSGSSGYISGSLLSLQTGSDPVSGKIKFRKREVISFEKSATEVTTAETAVGIAGSELLNVLITVDGTTTKYEQASSEDTTHVAYASGTKKITLPTDVATDAGTIEVVYEYEKDGASVGNSADTYGKTTHTFINCLGKNTCDETYFIQIEIYRCDWNANFDFDMGGDGVEHPFQFKSLVDKCGVGNSKFWDFKVYKTA
jgi:hypothetical protein|nr:MAG TPA: putative structural protein [Caudoviricetes sp.]